MQISSAFDSGNIEVVDASDPSNVQLRIRPDVGNEHMQWFHFRVSGAAGVPLTLNIVNAGAASYPKAWPGYQCCTSIDRHIWTRTDTSYDGDSGTLTIRHTPSDGVVWFAYFAPYSWEAHLDLVASCQTRGGQVDTLGQTLDGYDLDRVVIGDGPRVVWVIARQHPGESMAEHWMDGFLDRLLDPDDALARVLRGKATFHVVPNMNPDGSQRGHLRVNASGANLNREWHEPTMERSPEVKLVRDAMDVTGVDLCLDVHGDEELPYNFFSGAEGIPSYTDRLHGLLHTLRTTYETANPDFQNVHGYGVNEPGTANMTMCTNQVAERFDALAVTLEMPFKDNADLPDPLYGWSPERCQRLGASVLDAIAAVVDDLR